jgi:hypothetical protein
MSDCPHELWERENDVTADGSCPICLRAEIERLRTLLQAWQRIRGMPDRAHWIHEDGWQQAMDLYVETRMLLAAGRQTQMDLQGDDPQQAIRGLP